MFIFKIKDLGTVLPNEVKNQGSAFGKELTNFLRGLDAAGVSTAPDNITIENEGAPVTWPLHAKV